MTSRRALLLAGGASFVSWPLASYAQQPTRIARIGLLSPYSPSTSPVWNESFRQGLRDLGWIEGRNITIEYRYAEGRLERLPDLAADLVRLKVDAIVTSVTPDAIAAKKATSAIPIIMASPADPVASGLVESLARPGGNVTGLSQIGSELSGKRLELLKEIVPKLSRLAVLWNPQGPASILYWKELQAPARQLGLSLHPLDVRSPDELDKALEDGVRTRATALLVLPDPAITTNLKRIAEFAIRNRQPSLYHLTEFVEAGGLVTYGVDRADLFRRAAAFVDKILKGAKPGELPVEQATKFELAVNLKTARALGISIPQSLLLRANKVIE